MANNPFEALFLLQYLLWEFASVSCVAFTSKDTIEI